MKCKKQLDAVLEEICLQFSHFNEANATLVKLLGDRLSRIEKSQVATLKLFVEIDDRLASIEDIQKQHTKRQDLDELDRGQTASALHGLINRIDQLQKRLKEPA